jgi:hypothetical protein
MSQIEHRAIGVFGATGAAIADAIGWHRLTVTCC